MASPVSVNHQIQKKPDGISHPLVMFCLPVGNQTNPDGRPLLLLIIQVTCHLDSVPCFAGCLALLGQSLLVIIFAGQWTKHRPWFYRQDPAWTCFWGLADKGRSPSGRLCCHFLVQVCRPLLFAWDLLPYDVYAVNWRPAYDFYSLCFLRFETYIPVYLEQQTQKRMAKLLPCANYEVLRGKRWGKIKGHLLRVLLIVRFASLV